MKLLNHQSNTMTIDSQWLSNYLSAESPRYQHILGVVRCMENLLPRLNVPDEWKPHLLQACYLHDIGYSSQLNRYDFHPLDGAIFASAQGFPKPVVAAILFHSCSYEMVQETRHDLMEIYEENYDMLDQRDQLFIDLVTYCDLHTSSTGQYFTLDERVKDVVDRYGQDHPVSQMMLANRPNYEVTIERVNNLTKRESHEEWMHESGRDRRG